MASWLEDTAKGQFKAGLIWMGAFKFATARFDVKRCISVPAKHNELPVAQLKEPTLAC